MDIASGTVKGHGEEGEGLCSIVPLSHGRKGPPLMGRDWLSKIPLNWHHINKINTSTTSKMETQQLMMESFRRKFSRIMWDTIGTMAKIKGHLQLREGTSPVLMKARPVPYSLQTRNWNLREWCRREH